MSQAARSRLSVLTLALVVGALAIRELRVVPAAFAASQQPAPAAAALPAEAMSIPSLIVAGHEVRVSDQAAEAVASLGSATLRQTANDRGAVGQRQIRTYEVDGANVTVVLEPFEPKGASRVAGIYLN